MMLGAQLSYELNAWVLAEQHALVSAGTESSVPVDSVHILYSDIEPGKANKA